jgi:hypothetical protein
LHHTGVDAGAANTASLVKADAVATAAAEAAAGKRKAKSSITPTSNLDHAA